MKHSNLEENNRIASDFTELGLIAEDVYEYVPEICVVGYHELDRIKDELDESGFPIFGKIKEGAVKQPIDIRYDKLSVIMLGLLKEMNADIEYLKSEIAQLKQTNS